MSIYIYIYIYKTIVINPKRYTGIDWYPKYIVLLANRYSIRYDIDSLAIAIQSSFGSTIKNLLVINSLKPINLWLYSK